MKPRRATPLVLLLLAGVVTAATGGPGTPLAPLQEPLPGVASGAAVAPAFPDCASATAARSGARPGSVLLVEGDLTQGSHSRARLLRLSTQPSPDEADDLVETRWTLDFVAETDGELALGLRFETRDAADFPDGWALLLDGVPVACGTAADSRLAADDQGGWRRTPWMTLEELSGGVPLGAGPHRLEALVTDAVDSLGESVLLLDEAGLRPLAALPTPCRPAPSEDVGEIPVPPSLPKAQWTFDDNRFCPAGPGLGCAIPGVDPNPGTGFVDATGLSFEMYVVADCGTEMHIPLEDVESGCISVFDAMRNPITIRATNGAGYDQTGTEICWQAERCDGGGGNDPGGPGNEHVMDVSFEGNPTLCGVYILNFKSWGGCIWNLFANCNGTNTPQFIIYDDLCDAQARASGQLPELTVENLTTSDGGGCSVNYCVDIRNIGCVDTTSTLRVANANDVDLHVVAGLTPGERRTICGNLTVVSMLATATTTVTATADFGNAVVECSEAADASSCQPVTGGDQLSRNQLVECNSPPSCLTAGPHASTCRTATVAGATASDPNGDALTYAWTSSRADVTLAPASGSIPAGSGARPVPSATATLASGTAPCNVTATLTLRVTDPGGLTSTCVTTVTFNDNVLPTLLGVPADTTVACNAVPGVGAPTAADACDPSPVVDYLGESRANGPCQDTYTLTRSWQARDACDNRSPVDQQVITVRDVVVPTLANVPGNVTVPCTAVPSPGTPTASDNCDPAPIVTYLGETRTNGPCQDTYTLTRRWEARDRCANVSPVSQQVITVQDLVAPSLANVPADVTVACDAVPLPGAPTATDNCDLAPIVTYLGESRPDEACPDTYTLVRRWQARDRCSNLSTIAQQFITVRDLVAPTLANVPPNVTVACNAIPPVGTPTSSDNCDPAPSVVYLGETRNNGPCQDTYTLTRRWEARDRCTNVSPASQQVITVQDLVAPALGGVPANATVSCDAIPPVGTPTASDNCDPAPVVTYLGETRANGACLDTYTLTRRWEARDRCANVSPVSQQVITVRDLVAPTLAGVPASVTVSCDAIPPVGAPTAADNCDPAPVVTYLGETRTDGVCLDTYTLTRRWEARDRCANVSPVSQQVITVRDLVAPTLVSVPPNTTVPCTAVPAVGAPTATDNCDPMPLVTYLGETRADGPCQDTYTLTRTWQATDRCANTSAVSQQVITVQDLVPPTLLNVPADVTLECDQVPPPPQPGAADNCDPAPVVDYLGEVRTDGPCLDTYTLTRTWQARDRCGNLSAVGVQVVSLRDTTPPTFRQFPPDAVVPCDDVPDPERPVARDNCALGPVLVLRETRIDGACPQSYQLQREWTATDNCNNSSVRTQLVTVQDLLPPVLNGVPGDVTVACDAVPAAASPSATDNCDPNPALDLDEVRTDGPCADTYTLTRTWTATDACSNAASATQVVTVRDTVAPVITGVPSDTTVECNAVPAPASPSAADNCDPAPVLSFAEARTDGPCPDRYLLTRTWTATDRCTNAATSVQRVTVRDTVAPVILGVPANSTVECDSVPGAAATSATDNCDPAPAVVLREVRTDGACPDSYVLTRTWTATDRCTNASSLTQVLTVLDRTPPAVSALLEPRPALPPTSALPPASLRPPTSTLPPSPPAPPASPRPARSACSAPSSGFFTARCAATDNCDPAPVVAATLLVTIHDVPSRGTCVARIEEIPVLCDEEVMIVLVAPPCPAKPPRSPRSALSVTSTGLRIVTGEKVELRVTGTDCCGNLGGATHDPATAPAPPCADPLPDGSCCPAIAQPRPPKCPSSLPPCGT